MSNEDIRIHDVTTSLRSELAALQYKRDRLLSEVNLRNFEYLTVKFPLEFSNQPLLLIIRIINRQITLKKYNFTCFRITTFPHYLMGELPFTLKKSK